MVRRVARWSCRWSRRLPGRSSFRDLVVRAVCRPVPPDVCGTPTRKCARVVPARMGLGGIGMTMKRAAYGRAAASAIRSRGNTGPAQQPSMRREVLRLAARHDRDPARTSTSSTKHGSGRQKSSCARHPRTGTRRINPDDPPPDMAQRLSLARQLLEDGDVARALQFADPALYPVNTLGMNILDFLRVKNADAADQRYLSLLARAANDPVSDANTISLLSSYVFTPYLYITVRPDGNSHTRRWNDNNTPPSNLPPALRNAFFRTAASVLRVLCLSRICHLGDVSELWSIARDAALFERYGTISHACARASPCGERRARTNASIGRSDLNAGNRSRGSEHRPRSGRA